MVMENRETVRNTNQKDNEERKSEEEQEEEETQSNVNAIHAMRNETKGCC